MKNKIKFVVFLITAVIVLAVFNIFSYTFAKELFIDSSSDYELPKIIWSYWHSESDMPKLVKDIRTSNSNKIKNRWQYNFLTDDTIYEYINPIEFPKNYSSLIKQHKADWIRLYLLKNYGGCWMDASIIINNIYEVDNLYNRSLLKKSQMTVFTKDKPGINISIENWFIMAPKNSDLITLWYNEYTSAIIMGLDKYKEIILHELPYAINIYDNSSMDNVYLTMNACIQRLMYNNKLDYNDIILIRSENSMLKIHKECKLNPVCIMLKLKYSSETKKLPFIKLTRLDRAENIDISDFFK